MAKKQIPINAFPVIQAVARNSGPVSFSYLKEKTELAQATLNRVLKTLCEHRYTIKTNHGQYMCGPKLLNLGNVIIKNQITSKFEIPLVKLSRRTQLNAELYLITNNGPIFIKHISAPDEAEISMGYGHVILDRKTHPASLFYLSIVEHQKIKEAKKNYIIDVGGLWTELFRAAVMVPDTDYCLAVSGMIKNIKDDKYDSYKETLLDIASMVKEEIKQSELNERTN